MFLILVYYFFFPCRQSYPRPLVTNWTSESVVERWKISVDLFSRLFLSDGPGAERDSFLAARAGVAGRLARYLFTIMALGLGKQQV